MTDWRFAGERPPATASEWVTEFERYRESPEGRLHNADLSLGEFKFIYWMEWAHRMWGRGLGLYVAAPLAVFAARGWIGPRLGLRVGVLFCAGGAQALVGWWMVRSGLEEPPPERALTPRVSPWRLAAHLASAFAIYGGLLWTWLGARAELAANKAMTVVVSEVADRAALRLASLRALPALGLVATTAASGALVAGLDAGRVYSDFPWMNGRLVPLPTEYWDDRLMPRWRSLGESPAAVQFDHRALAVTTLAAGIAQWAAFPRAGGVALGGPRRLAALVAVAVVGQACLGVATLWGGVPPALGSAHQAGALFLGSLSLALVHSLAGLGGLAGVPALVVATRVGTPAVGALTVGASLAAIKSHQDGTEAAAA